MNGDQLLDAWAFDGVAFDLAAVAAAAQDGQLGEPDLKLALVSSAGDTITVKVVDGIVPGDPTARLYVGRRGAYELLRRETWPGPRVLLTLAAWPRR